MTEHQAALPAADRRVAGLILILIVGYIAATAAGWTRGGPLAAHATALADHAVSTDAAVPADAAAQAPGELAAPPVWLVLPFVLLLGAIAILPLLQGTAHWWESNRNKLYVAANVALVTLLLIALFHPSASFSHAGSVLIHTLANEYIPFIVLLFSLYTISGGIRIAGDLPAHPRTNTTFMAVGALLASFIGTTGAAMLLVRPLIETNRERRQVAHTIVFFIFIVCNCGGLLLPLGDPPLLLGYLSGVDFFWTVGLWKNWLLVNGLLLAVYFAWDHFYSYPRERPADVAVDEARRHRLRMAGLWPSVPLLFGVVLSVALLDPAKAVPGTNWHPWFYLREVVQLGLVLVSLVGASRHVRRSNSFDYLAIGEVAILFVGIFISMQPALEILKVRGGDFGLDSPLKYFWATGALSSVLDNAPTYLVFFEAARAQTATGYGAGGEVVAGVAAPLLAAISLAAVTMGAMTYIGNGPNFMVKAIAEQAGIKMPGFFAFAVYSCCVLLPILLLDVWLFLDRPSPAALTP